MINLNEAQIIIELWVIWDQVRQTLQIDQKAYIQTILEEEGMTNCQLILISIKSGFFITLDEPGDEEKIDMQAYQVIVRKLMYLVCDIRPDISFVVECLSQNNRDLQVGHLKTVKKVLQYLKEMSQMCIKYEQSICRNIHDLLLHDYTDSNYTRDLLN